MYALLLLVTIVLSITSSVMNGMQETTALLPSDPIIHFIPLPGHDRTPLSINTDPLSNPPNDGTRIMNIWLAIKYCCLCNCCDNT